MANILNLTDSHGDPIATKFLGILYAEDFDDEPAAPAATEPPPAPVAPALTQADVEAACVSAVAAAHAEWETHAARRRAELLASIAQHLADARQQAEATAADVAEAAVTALLSMLAAMLPKLCDEHGPAEVRAVLDHVLPMLKSEPKVVVRVHPDLVADLRQDLLDLQADIAGVITVAPAPIERGDLRISWDKGALTRDTRQMLRAMQDVLVQLRLGGTPEPSVKRSLAYAE